MKHAILCCCVVIAFAALNTRANAQMRYTWSFNCQSNVITQNIPTANRTSVGAVVGMLRCSGLTGEIAGSAIKSWTHSYYVEAQGNQFRAWGVMVQTLASGDEVNFISQGNGTLVNGQQKTGQMEYQIIGGTGKVAGIKGSGACTIAYGAAGANAVATCNGEYMLP
jgi:hypothetical protein